MKRNLSSQAIRAMAIGMAVTMGATTALSGVVGNVAVVKAAETTENGTNKPSASTYKYVEVKISDGTSGNVYLNFEITADDATENNEAADSGKAKLVSITANSKNTTGGIGEGNTEEAPYKGEIVSDMLKVTYNTSDYVYFDVTQVADVAGLSSTPITVDGTQLSSILKKATTVKANAFANVTVIGNLELPAVTTAEDGAFKGATVSGDLDLSTATGINENAFKGISNDDRGVAVTGELKLKSNYTGGANAFNYVNIGVLNLTDKSSLTATATFEGSIIETLTLPEGYTGAAGVFKCTIVGDLDISNVTAINVDSFKGAVGEENKGITVTGTLKLKENFAGNADTFAYTDIAILDLSNNSTNLDSLKFANAKIGELKLGTAYTGAADAFNTSNITTLDLSTPTAANPAATFTNATIGTLTLPAAYTGAANAFEGATVTELKFPLSFTGQVVSDTFAGSSAGATITTLDLTNVIDDKLDNKFGTGAADTAATITNIIHNGVTKIGGAKVKGNVTFNSNCNISTAAFEGTKFEEGSKIIVENANQLQATNSANAFNFEDSSNITIEFGAYSDTSDKANVVAACGNGVASGKVKILLPKNTSEVEVSNLNTALVEGSATNVKAYANNVTAGIDNPTSAITLNQNDYILTSNGELFKVVRAKGTGDIPVAEAAFVGTVAEAGAGGEANGTTIPYVATLTEDTLSIASSSGEAVTCKVNQIGDGVTALSKYTINGSISNSEVLPEYTLNVPTGKSVEIANKAFENITNVTITSTEGITAIGNEAFKGATITSGTLNTVNVTSFGASAFEGATLTPAQEIVVNETASVASKAFAFKTATAGTKVKLQAYTADDQATVIGAFTDATGLENVTIEIPYSLTAEADAQALTEALTSTGVTATVAAKGNQGTVAPKQGDIISTTSGDVFEVLEGDATVKLVSLGNQQPQSRVATTFDGSFENGVVTVQYDTSGSAKTATFNVTELGNGSKAITTGTVAVDTLIPYLTNSTTLASKALEGTTIVAGPKVSITIPETLTTLGATSLQLSNQSAIVIKVPGYGTNDEQQITQYELVKAIGTTQAQITIELPAGADSAALKAALTSAPRVEVRTELPADAIGTTVKATKEGVGAYTFKIIEQENTADVEKTTKNKVALVEFTPVEAPSTREAEANFSGAGVQINGVDYALSQLGDGENPIKGVTDAALDAITTTNVTTVAANAFKDNKDVTKIDLTIAGTIEANAFAGSGVTSVNLPLATEIGESAFAGADKLQTVDLPKVTTVGDSAFSKTSVTTVSLPSATTIGASAFQNTKVEKVDLPKAETIGSSAFESTRVQSINAPKATTVGANAFANNEKLVSVNVGTEATGQIKIDSSALSGSSNITVVNTNKDSKDQVTEAIKQSGTQNNVTVSAGGATETVKPEETTTSRPTISGGGANIGSSNGSSNTTTETVTETTTETTTEGTTQTPDKTLSLDVISLPSVEGEAVSFSDVSDSSWAKSYIDKLSTAGIISGSNGKFNPNGQTKRADVTVMLVKLLGLTPETNNKFTDVDPNAYYAPYVGAASSYGIVNGSNGMFKPESVISRQDTMVMIAQILRGLNLNVNTDTSTLNQFSDVNNISSYAQESVAVLVNSGIISGSNGKLNPTKPVTRAEMATIMSKLYDLIDSAN